MVSPSWLEGELFQADVTCMADNSNGKLMFKFNGTRILSNRGSFVANAFVYAFLMLLNFIKGHFHNFFLINHQNPIALLRTETTQVIVNIFTSVRVQEVLS